jgi:tetratricopeptide (TPR) repeat protein
MNRCSRISGFVRGWLLAALVLCAGGCRMMRDEGPVPKTLARSRQLSQQAIAALQQGRSNDAERLGREAVACCPTDLEARKQLAEAMWQNGRLREAAEQFDEALRLAPRDTDLLVRSGQLYLEAARFDSAALRAEEAIRSDPQSASAWRLRGAVQHATGQNDGALSDYLRALGYRPHDSATLLALARLYRQTGRSDRALAAVRVILESYPAGEEPAELLVLEGETLAELRRYDEAADRLARGIARGNPSADWLAQLAEIELRAGRVLSAHDSLRRSLTLDPSHNASLALLRELESAQRDLGVLR